ncbi:PIG-L family deacetylase, partial [Candidatus Gottesmanbacteria bacterium]|nr:PIG-L family deacetylase [Candidatus Gottesmanbacteria bacterium]
MKRLLLVFAHPDDESFTAAGTIVKYQKAGWVVTLVCATHGEKGEAGPYAPVSSQKLGAIRQKELEEAAAVLGISHVSLLDYKDGKLATLEAGELENIIYKKMEETVPDCIITFNTTGISNHPDHIKISYATTFAFQKYAAWVEDQLRLRSDIKADVLPKLYYACMPQSIATFLKENKNIPTQSFGKPWVGIADKLVTAVIDIKRFSGVKRKALLSHRSQQADVQRFLSFAANPLARYEYFILRMHGTTEVFMGKNDRVSN